MKVYKLMSISSKFKLSDTSYKTVKASSLEEAFLKFLASSFKHNASAKLVVALLTISDGNRIVTKEVFRRKTQKPIQIDGKVFRYLHYSK